MKCHDRDGGGWEVYSHVLGIDFRVWRSRNPACSGGLSHSLELLLPRGIEGGPFASCRALWSVHDRFLRPAFTKGWPIEILESGDERGHEPSNVRLLSARGAGQ